MPASVLRVQLLGGLAVDGVDPRRFGSRKARQLFAALAVHAGRPASPDLLVELLWGDHPPSRPLDQLAVLVSRLRTVVGGDRIVRQSGGYLMRLDWLDLVELNSLVVEAASRHADGQAARALTAAQAAVALARGPLLPEESGVWWEAERVQASTSVSRADKLVAEIALAMGDWEAAAAAGEAGLVRSPYDEVLLRTVMRAHAGAGRPGTGLAAYVRVRDRLVEDLGVSPAPETERLHDAVVLGEAGAAQDGLEQTTVTGPVPAELGLTAPLPAHLLVGRERHLAILDTELALAAGGAARVVAVQGEAGAGKSALVDTWRSRLGNRATVLRGRCDDLGRDLPLQPIADALARHLRAVGPSDRVAAISANFDLLDELIFGGPSKPTSTISAAPDSEIGQARLFGALLGLLEKISTGPVVLIVEDLHDAGALTIAWLAYALRRADRLLLVVTSRTSEPVLPEARVVTLDPLDRSEAEALVGPDRVDALLARSGGNPLLLTALAAASSDELPASIREFVEAQVRRLGAAAVTLRVAAVVGDVVELDLVAEAVQRPAVEVLNDLETALAVGLLVERPDGLGFRHQLIREALVAGAGSARRALAHRQVAAVLHRRQSPDLLAVAQHARLGGDAALASRAFVEAARAALVRFDASAALTHLDMAVALDGSLEALLLRARTRMACLDLAGAETDAVAARALDGGGEALECSAWIAYYRRRYTQARALAELGAKRAGDHNLRASCLAVAGRIDHGTGELAGAAERLEEASASEEVGSVAGVWLAHVRVHQGRPAEALALAEASLVDPEAARHPWADLHGQFARIMALGHLGRIAEGLRCCGELDAAAARAGPMGARFVGIAANVRGWLLRSVGRSGEGEEHHQRAIAATGDVARSSADARTEPYWVGLLDLADARLWLGDLDGAHRWLIQAMPLDVWDGTMGWHHRQRLGVLRARLSLAQGDPSTAAELAAAAQADAAARGAHRYRHLAGAVLGLAGEGDRAQAAAVVEGLAATSATDGWRFMLALADHHRVDAWRREAEQRALALATAAGPFGDDARRMMAAVFTADA